MKLLEMNLTQMIEMQNALKELPDNLDIAKAMNLLALFLEWYYTNDPEIWNKIVENVENKDQTNDPKEIHLPEGG